jgi:hypothetical protein
MVETVYPVSLDNLVKSQTECFPVFIDEDGIVYIATWDEDKVIMGFSEYSITNPEDDLTFLLNGWHKDEYKRGDKMPPRALRHSSLSGPTYTLCPDGASKETVLSMIVKSFLSISVKDHEIAFTKYSSSLYYGFELLPHDIRLIVCDKMIDIVEEALLEGVLNDRLYTYAKRRILEQVEFNKEPTREKGDYTL